MHLTIDLRRKKVKIEFEATQAEMTSKHEVEVEIKMNKRQNEAIKQQIPAISAKLLHYLTLTNVALLDSSYEEIEGHILRFLEEEKRGERPI
jgi:hypothetical protein